MSDITILLDAVGRGENHAAEELLPLVYDELRHLAASRMADQPSGQTLQPTALVHEAWLRLVHEADPGWNNRVHFFRAAALAMRHILVDRARQKSSLKHARQIDLLKSEDLDSISVTPDDRILLVDEALALLETEDPESARLITLKFFGGFTHQEIAASLGLTERSIERHWAYARTRLFKLIQDNR